MLRDDFRYFWAEWSAGFLALQVCMACGSARFYPGPLCPNCSSRQFEWRRASGGGVVHSVTEVAPRRGAGGLDPTTVALVELPESVRVLGVIDGADAAVEIGAEVQIAPDGSAHGPIRFRPI